MVRPSLVTVSIARGLVAADPAVAGRPTTSATSTAVETGRASRDRRDNQDTRDTGPPTAPRCDRRSSWYQTDLSRCQTRTVAAPSAITLRAHRAVWAARATDLSGPRYTTAAMASASWRSVRTS